MGERIISADDHMDLNVLPRDLFTDRVAARWRGEVPRVEETPDGPFWVVEGRRLRPSGHKPQGMISAGEDRGMRPGIPEQRLEDMDTDGIYCSVIYGPVGPGFVTDPELRGVSLRAYNDWAAEFNRGDPNRLIALPLLPSFSPEVATAELQRVVGDGHRGAIVEYFETTTPAFEDDWEPFWAAADELGVPIHFHLGGGTHSIQYRPHSWRQPASVTVAPLQLDEALVGMIFAGIFQRYPRVKLVLAEAGLGWLPYVIARMDHEWEKYNDRVEDFRLPEPPSHYFNSNVMITYEEDDLGLELLTGLGLSNLMWASDYPHGDSTWPSSRKAIMESALGKLDHATRTLITWSNAAGLYGVDRPVESSRP